MGVRQILVNGTSQMGGEDEVHQLDTRISTTINASSQILVNRETGRNDEGLGWAW
jgi:hypothetical protein